MARRIEFRAARRASRCLSDCTYEDGPNGFSGTAFRIMSIAVIIVNYGTADLAVEAVESVLERDHGGRAVEVEAAKARERARRRFGSTAA